MKKQIFHMNLYKEKLKQLRLIGFISLGLLSLMAILSPIGMAMSARRAYDYSSGGYIREAIGIAETHYYLFFVFTLLVPLLALYCFHYLTQRNSSDFYHSLPHTRTCVFTCNIAAVFTWTTLLVWVPTILSIIMYTIFNKFFILEIALLLRFAFFIYLASLLVIASISVACSITGTLFTNVIVSGMIIFLPRIFILMFTELITGATDLLVSNHLFPLLDLKYNAVFGNLSYLDRSSGMGFGTALYTIILTAAYLAIGLLAYIRRKSESAGQAAVSKRVQLIIRLILGTTVSLIPITLIFNIITGNEPLKSSDIPLFIYTMGILYLIACVVMLLYELLTTKKFKNVIKALPSIGYLAIINVVIILAAFGAYKAVISYSPDAEDIDYIVVEPYYSHGSPESYGMEEEAEYYKTLANSIKMDDKETLQLVAKCLKNTINEGWNGFESGDDSLIVVGIHSGFTTHYRRIIFPLKDYKALLSSYENSKEYQAAYQSLPNLSGSKLSLYNLKLSNEEYLQLYEIAREEIKSLKFKDWYLAVTNQAGNRLDTLIFYATVDNRSLMGSIPINGLLPKTCMKYLELADRQTKDNRQTIQTEMKHIWANEYKEEVNYYLDCEILDVSGNKYIDYGMGYEDLTQDQAQAEVLATNRSLLDNLMSANKQLTDFDPNKDYAVRINYRGSIGTDRQYAEISCILVIDKAKLEFLMNYYNTPEEPMENEDIVY